MYRSATKAMVPSDWVAVCLLAGTSLAVFWILGQVEGEQRVSKATAYALFGMGFLLGQWLTMALWRRLVAKLRQEIEAGGR
jgi:hypothetical protein